MKIRERVTTTISTEMKDMLKDNDLAISDVLSFGANFLLAEKDFFEYPSCKLLEKMGEYKQLLEEKCLELEKLKKLHINCTYVRTPQEVVSK